MSFLDAYNQAHQQPVSLPRASHPWLRMAVLCSVIVLVVGIGIWSAFVFRNVMREGLHAYSETRESVALLTVKQFADARVRVASAESAWRETWATLQSTRWIRWVPVLGRYLNAGEDLADAGIYLTSALRDGITLAERLRAPLGEAELTIDFLRLSREQRRQLIGILHDAPVQIHDIQENIDRGLDHIDRALGVLPVQLVGDRVSTYRDSLELADRALRRLEDLAVILPAFVGYPEPSTNLFLYQNNNELRPSGGFIGAYGLMEVDNGAITALRTDDVYRLDTATPKDAVLPVAPVPIKKYLGVKKFYFRDANWSPDFPTSAATLLDLYHREAPSAREPRAIVAITPTLLERIMTLTGPITVDGITFTPEHVTDTLEYEVEQGFAERHIALEDRKVIVGKLMDEVVARLHHLPREQTPALLDIIGTALAEKHIMLYHTDPLVQQEIQTRGWGGAFPRVPDVHFLSVIDANLGSLKTDQVMERSVAYRVNFKGMRPRATVTLTYRNLGQFTWKTTRYQTYVRVYAPEGSTLVEAVGLMDRSRSKKQGVADTLHELGYAVFGGFTAVEPGEERSIRFTYDLPESFALRTGNEHRLLVAKQPGTIAVPLTVRLDFDKNVVRATPGEDHRDWGDARYELTTDLRVDREFNISF